jgi:hypothetical protein
MVFTFAKFSLGELLRAQVLIRLCRFGCSDRAFSLTTMFLGAPTFDTKALRNVLDGHDIELREELYRIFATEPLFKGPRGYSAMDYDTTMAVCASCMQCILFSRRRWLWHYLRLATDALYGQEQRDITMQRIAWMVQHGYYRNILTADPKVQRRIAAVSEAVSLFDHSQAVKTGVHFQLWYDHSLHQFIQKRCRSSAFIDRFRAGVAPFSTSEQSATMISGSSQRKSSLSRGPSV